MGEYRNGRWVPTFGDDQFGVCSTERMDEEKRRLQKIADENNAGESANDILKTENEK